MKRDDCTTMILEEVRDLGEPDARDEQFGHELADLLLACAADLPQPCGTKALAWPRPRRRFRPLAAPAAALAVLAVILSFMFAGHGGASADALLHRVAAATFPPNQAQHLIYDVTMTLSGRTAHGTAEIWIATDKAGKPVAATETLRVAKVASAPTLVVERDQQTPLGTYTYDGTHNAIVIPSRNDPGWSSRETETLPLPLYLFDGTTVAQRLIDLSSQGAVRVQLLSPRTIDGTSVDAVEVDGWPNGSAVSTTLYFDRSTHQLRGFDSHGTDATYNSPTYQVRLAQQTSTRRASAPTDAFALDAPASALVSPPPPDMAVLMGLCRSQIKLLLAGGEDLLAACRAGNAVVTRNELLAALVGTAPQDLAGAVAAHAITAEQAQAALQAQRTQIIALLSAPHPGLGSSAAAGK